MAEQREGHYTLTWRNPDGSGTRHEHTLDELRERLESISRVIQFTVPGESFTVERIA